MIVKINDRFRVRKVDFFNKFKINLRYDAIASDFSFEYYFNPDNNDHKEMSCIGHYHECAIEHNGATLLTGYIISTSLPDEPVEQLAAISGYSLPGVLQACNIPPTLYPLQSEGLSLREITQKYIRPFGLKLKVDSSVSALANEKYEEMTASESQTIKDFITELCNQKNIILSHNGKGEIVMTRPTATQLPVADFSAEGAKWNKMKLNFDGQGMHSDLFMLEQADVEFDEDGEQQTIQNPYVPIVFRPHVSILTAGQGIDASKAVRNALAKELRGMTLTIEIPDTQINGVEIRPGQTITATNPKCYLYKKSTWFIESMQIEGDQERTTSVLNCVVPEVYNGQTPKYLFKGINMHR